MAKVVMENCKRLDIFHAPYLLVKDIEIPDTSNEQGGENNEMGFKHEDQSKLEDEQDIASSLGQHPGPWSCLDLHTLYIGATAPSYASPPLTKREEDVIRTRLKSLCKLRNYQVGATISSASPPWLDK
ncbi:hypothetical protein BGZ46_010496 [Entomortierella lignicola]|nr:hypothetical protein BGZ46_010496 [Entomortierella lignicola]